MCEIGERILHQPEGHHHPAVAASFVAAACSAAAVVVAFVVVAFVVVDGYSAYMLLAPELELASRITVELGPALPSDD